MRTLPKLSPEALKMLEEVYGDDTDPVTLDPEDVTLRSATALLFRWYKEAAAEEHAAKPDKAFWISWYATDRNGPYTLRWPWWISGYRLADDAKTICAAVQAPFEEAAKMLIVEAHDKTPPLIEWRFCIEKPDDWSPYTSDRFQKADWMPEWRPPA